MACERVSRHACLARGPFNHKMESLLLTPAHKRSEPHVTSVLASDRKRIEEILISHGFDNIKLRSGQSICDVYSPETSFENIKFELAAFSDNGKSYGKLSISYPIDAKLKVIYDGLVLVLRNEAGIDLLATTVGLYKASASPYSWNSHPCPSSPCEVIPLVR